MRKTLYVEWMGNRSEGAYIRIVLLQILCGFRKQIEKDNSVYAPFIRIEDF